MDPLTGGLISGGLSVAGTLLSNEASSAQAERQMQFQREMSNTAHQREVKDLRAAGLNPILSALGSGASTPAGAAGQVNDLGAGISKGADTALAIRSQNKELEVKDQTIDNMRDTASNIVADTKKKWEDIKGTRLSNHTIELQNKLLRETLPHAIKEAKAKGDWSQVNQLMGVIKAGTSSAKDAVDIVNPLKIKVGK